MELVGVYYTILDIGGLGADGFTVTLGVVCAYII